MDEADDNNSEVCPYDGLWITATCVVAITNFVACCGCFWFMGRILTAKREVRTNTFNLYVVFLLFPDAINNGIVSIYSVFRMTHCGVVPPFLADMHDFELFFYYFSNFYLNVVVACELYILLKRSNNAQRTKPPPMKRAIGQIAIVYVLAFLYALWACLDVPWSFYDQPNFGSPEDGVFSETAAMAMSVALFVIPIIIVVGIRIKVALQKMMPKEGNMRVLSLFFERIIIVFLAFYIPTMILNVLASFMESVQSASFFWTEMAILLLSAGQAFVTLYMVSFKDDIRKSVVPSWWCWCQTNSGNSNPTRTSQQKNLDRCDQSNLLSQSGQSSDAMNTTDRTMTDSSFFRASDTSKKKYHKESEVEIVFERTSEIENEDLEEDLEEVESEVEIVYDRTSEIQKEDLAETVGREEV